VGTNLGERDMPLAVGTKLALVRVKNRIVNEL